LTSEEHEEGDNMKRLKKNQPWDEERNRRIHRREEQSSDGSISKNVR